MHEEEKQRVMKALGDYQRHNPADRTAAMGAIQGKTPEQPIEQKPTQGKPYAEQLEEIARQSGNPNYRPDTEEEVARNRMRNAANGAFNRMNSVLTPNPVVSIPEALNAAQRRKVQGAANTGGVIGEAAEEQAQEQLKKMPTLFDLARAARLNPNEKRKVKATRQKTDSKGNPIGEPEEIELEESSVEEMF